MKRFLSICFVSVVFLVFSAGSVVAGDGGTASDQPAASVNQADQVQAQDGAGGCPAEGNCCGSRACAEAKKVSREKGKAALADCPCKRNRLKPQHGTP